MEASLKKDVLLSLMRHFPVKISEDDFSMKEIRYLVYTDYTHLNTTILEELYNLKVVSYCSTYKCYYTTPY